SWTRGDWLSFASQHSDGTNGAAFPDVNWQWEHKTGWRDYTKKVSTKIEIAWRSGETKVRVQTGKRGPKSCKGLANLAPDRGSL
ncbi:unnamed protein product, partial [Effrenium voratum]